MTHMIKSIVLDKKHPIYVGIDVHKKTWSYTLIHQDQMVERASVPGEVKVLLERLKKFEGFQIYSVYEAGFSGYFLHKALIQNKIKNIIVAPNKIPVLTGDRVKTDKIDSLKLATFLSKGLLRGIHIPEDHLIEFRQILRTRRQLKEVRQTLARQIKGLLLQFHIDIPEQGYAYLRGLLVEVSWTLIKKDPAMKQFYERIKSQTGSGKKAIVAVARKFICRLYAIMKKDEPYELGLVS